MSVNNIIREKARRARVPLWQIAVRLNVSEPTMTRWLRAPLSKERERLILAAIDDIRGGGSNGKTAEL